MLFKKLMSIVKGPASTDRPGTDGLILRLLKMGLRRQGKFYAIGIAAMVAVASMSSLTAWSMQAIVDTMTNPDNHGQVLSVSLMVIAIFASKGVATYVQSVSMARAGNGIIAEQQNRVYDRLLRQGVDFFNVTETSDLLMRVTQGAQAARGLIDTIVTSMVRDLLTLIGLLAVMFFQQPVLSVVSLVLAPLVFFGIRIILRYVREVMSQQMAGMAEIIKVVQETSVGIRVIKIFSLEKVMETRMRKAVGEVENRANSLIRMEAITSPMMETLSGVAIAGVVWLSAANIMGGEPTTAGQMMSFVTALLMAYEPAKRLSRMRVSIEAQKIGVTMLFDMLDRDLTISEKADAGDLEVTRGEMRFEDVSFRYSNGPNVIEDLSMEFPAGQTIALVGESGAGKSTIINLMMRFYDPTAGRITLDGQDIAHVTFDSLRSQMSFVGQDTFLFSASVMDNIRCSRPDATDAEVEEAARAAHAHDFIMKLSQGYHTPVGENGTFLSGGQRQRLAIARAFLRRAKLLLLDEATSALDSVTENLVKDGLKKVSAGATTVIIAHRLSTIMRADRVYVLGQGKVLEYGSASELLARDGAFRRLHDQQFHSADS